MTSYLKKLSAFTLRYRKGLEIACFALLFMAFFVATACGLGMTTDSFKYSVTAQNLVSSGEFITVGGKPYTYWPPLFPIVLALLPSQSPWLLNLLNAACLLGSILIWYRISCNYLTPNWRLFYLFTLCSATPILMVHVYVWTEPIFLLMFSGYLYSLHRFLEKEALNWLLSATIFAFFMLLQRNAGIMLLMGMSLGILIFRFDLFKRRFGYFLTHGFFSVSGWAVWQYWQYFIRKQTESIDYFFVTEIDWLKYDAFLKAWYSHWLPRDAPGAAVGFVVLVIFFVVMGKKTIFDPYQKSLWFMIGFYVLLLLVMPFTTHRDAIRYQAIFIPPLFLNIVFIFQKPFRALSQKIQLVVLCLLIIWMLYPLARIAKNTVHFHQVFCLDASIF